MSAGVHLREAEPDDYDDVVAFTSETWADRETSDYLPDVYHDWIAGDPDRKRTLVADAGDDIAGLCQVVFLSDHEAWAQGMRVNPAYRGEGIGVRLNDALFTWAREQGATVCRNMVFSWNVAGLGISRAAGYDPRTEFRWARPEPDTVDDTDDHEIVSDPDAAWSFWQRSTARRDLADLTLAMDESWAVSELTRETLHRAAEETRAFAVKRPDEGTRAMAYRTRDFEYGDGDEAERVAEYGVGAWADLDAARALFGAIGADAADLGADRTRVLIPETVTAVSDVAALRIGVSEEPDFVLEADLT
ncbi:GNAT family N-acetyltransferase [Halococcus salsus]|uniref:GNAT family N-acetyltransferase n=1 Tax=Halococcus salsus TaxID=2162894 RepID=UPI00135A2A62|nr:GNAT family N-acetyltransferase [Halococcus salsus]